MGRVHAERRTPWVGILFTTGLAAALVAVGDLETLAATTVLLLLGVFVVVNVAVLVLRREPVEHEHWRAPTALPVLGALAAAGLLAQKAIQDPADLIWAGALLALGVVLWLVTRAVAGPVRELDPEQLVD
jgi:amino acid transporter